jgi:hypothetical protein
MKASVWWGWMMGRGGYGGGRGWRWGVGGWSRGRGRLWILGAVIGAVSVDGRREKALQKVLQKQKQKITKNSKISYYVYFLQRFTIC